jgi:hypothetical protein
MVPTVGRLGSGVEEVVQPRLTIDVEGRIVGQTDPKVVPETDEEVEMGFKNNIAHGFLQPNDPHFPPQLSVDESGQILGLTPKLLKVVPETELERVFLAQWRGQSL